MEKRIYQRLLAEYIGSLVLVVAAIGPIILAHHVLNASVALAVLMDAIAVGFVLFVLIEIFGPISECHINPAVSISMILSGRMKLKIGILYIIVQFLGGLSGTVVAHLMFFNESFFQILTISTVSRSQGPYIGEFFGTFILILTIYGCIYSNSTRAGSIIGLLVGGLLLTTSSTMFANPQVTVARMFTFAIAGVSPLDGFFFILVQILASITATYTAGILFAPVTNINKDQSINCLR